MINRRTHDAPRGGFNLIESAIVLGVIGLVIGGIWVAASKVQQNLEITRTAEHIIRIKNKTLALYKNTPWSAPASGAYEITPLIEELNLFPEDWKDSKASTFGRVRVYQGDWGVETLNITFEITDKDLCNKFIITVGSISAKDTEGLRQITTWGGSGQQIFNAPIDPTSISCQDTVSGVTVWYYR